ncbi:MAG: YbjN domain-containing protein [Devosia sp.]|nr:YbjN domain-containing protein [Devosia sp.]
MKFAISAALLGGMFGLAGSAGAQELLDGGRVDEILVMASAYGTASLEAQANGDPRIAGDIGGVPYQLFFLNCTANTDCEDLNFYAGFRDIKPTMDALNAWNRDKRFGNAYLDADLDAVIEYDVNVQYGVSRDNLDAAFGLWTLLSGEFADYVGYLAP